MPKPKLEFSSRYLTAVQVAERLGMSLFKLNYRIEKGIFPQPTYVDKSGKQPVRYFDEKWVKVAQKIMK